MHNFLFFLGELIGVNNSMGLLLEVAAHGLTQLALAVAQGGDPVVFDRVVAAADKNVGDLGPAIVNGFLEDKKDPVFFDAPRTFLAQGVQLVVPPFTALFTRPLKHLLCDQLPLEWSQLGNDVDENFVLLVVPCSLGRSCLQQLLLLLLNSALLEREKSLDKKRDIPKRATDQGRKASLSQRLQVCAQLTCFFVAFLAKP